MERPFTDLGVRQDRWLVRHGTTMQVVFALGGVAFGVMLGLLAGLAAGLGLGGNGVAFGALAAVVCGWAGWALVGTRIRGARARLEGRWLPDPAVPPPDRWRG